jgi:hypothetical protein
LQAVDFEKGYHFPGYQVELKDIEAPVAPHKGLLDFEADELSNSDDQAKADSNPVFETPNLPRDNSRFGFVHSELISANCPLYVDMPEFKQWATEKVDKANKAFDAKKKKNLEKMKQK